jgi:hypothetical protein
MNKRIFSIGILALSLGMAGFANPNPNNGKPNMPKRNRQERVISPEMQKQRIAMEEKMLDIKKEMIKDKPDWNKVEKLNREIALERASAKTERLKQMKAKQNLPKQ